MYNVNKTIEQSCGTGYTTVATFDCEKSAKDFANEMNTYGKKVTEISRTANFLDENFELLQPGLYFCTEVKNER